MNPYEAPETQRREANSRLRTYSPRIVLYVQVVAVGLAFLLGASDGIPGLHWAAITVIVAATYSVAILALACPFVALLWCVGQRLSAIKVAWSVAASVTLNFLVFVAHASLLRSDAHDYSVSAQVSESRRRPT